MYDSNKSTLYCYFQSLLHSLISQTLDIENIGTVKSCFTCEISDWYVWGMFGDVFEPDKRMECFFFMRWEKFSNRQAFGRLSRVYWAQRHRFESQMSTRYFFQQRSPSTVYHLLLYAAYESSAKVNRWPEHTRELRGKNYPFCQKL